LTALAIRGLARRLRGFPRRPLVLLVAGAAFGLQVPEGHAQQNADTAEARVDFNIAPQNLSDALIELGRQAGVQIAFQPQSVGARRAPALRGRYTVGEAIHRLLAGSGMRARRGASGAWIVEAAARNAGRADAQPDGAPGALAEEVTITGSRIVRRDLDAASPIVTVEGETFEHMSNVGVEAALVRLPQFQPAGTQFESQAIVANAFSSPGISSLDLRGLGPNRSLVLVDGRRAQPANATLTVDVNSIPLAAIDSVEVISGGASAVYGADAIAGVVNFKLKRDFQGVALDLQSGITQAGDGNETRFSAVLGANLADGRGNVLFGAEWARRGAVQQRNRDFFRKAWADPGTPGGEGGGDLRNVSSYVPNPVNLPSQAMVDAIFADGPPVSNATAFYVNPDGTLFKNTLVPGNPAASSVGYTGPMEGIKLTNQGVLVQPDRTQNLSSPLDRYSLFGRAVFDFNERVGMVVQANFSSNDVLTTSTVAPATTATFNTPIPRDAEHPLPPELEALLDSRPNPTAPFHVDRYLDFLGPRRAQNQSTVYQVLLGFNGELPIRDWTWDAHVSHGETRLVNYLKTGWASRERLRRVVSAPQYGKGLTMTSAGSYVSTCTTGLPIFEYFTPSQDCIDAISIRMKNLTDLEQNIVELNVQGGLLDLPAGALRGALGASYRKNSVLFDPDTLNDTESVLDMPIGLFAAANTQGETKVKELYAELLVPVLAGRRFVQELDLELGGRYSNYNLSGGSWTYKGLATWRVNDFLSFRGGYQYANRAPNIAELFLGVTQQVVSQPDRDPCTVTTAAAYGNVPGNPNRAQVQALCSAIIGSGTSLFDLDPNNFLGQNGPNFPFEREARTGNVDLKPEKADTVTAGAVVRVPFASPVWDRTTLSIDYYSIRLRDTIGPLAATTIYRGCFNADGVSNPTYSLDDPNGYCRLIQRDPVTGGRLQVTAPLENLGLTETSGIDVQLNWRSDLADMRLPVPGTLALDLMFNYLLDFTIQTTPFSPKLQNRGAFGQLGSGGIQTGQFRYRSFTTLSWLHGGRAVGLNWQHLPSIHNAAWVINHDTPVQGAGSYNLLNVFGSWQVSPALSLRAGIDNLFDREAEIVGREEGVTNALGETVPAFYDLLGRRFYAGVTLNF